MNNDPNALYLDASSLSPSTSVGVAPVTPKPKVTTPVLTTNQIAKKATSSGLTPDIINSAYQNILGRAADPEGLRHYTTPGEIGGITNQAALEADLRNSTEYKQKNTAPVTPIPTVATSVAPSTPTPAASPAFINPYNLPAYTSAKSAYTASLAPSPELTAAQQKLNNLETSAQLGQQKIEDQPIPMGLILGQGQTLQKLAGIQQEAAQKDVALAQTTQQQQQAQALAALQLAAQEAGQYAPMSIGDNIVQYDPATGQLNVLYSAPKDTSPTANQKDYEYAKSQGYTGSFLDFQREQALLNPSAYATSTDAFGNTTVINKLGDNSSITTPAARNNNPGNIKVPAGGIEEARLRYNDPGAQIGSQATDGGYFIKFSDSSKGLAAIPTLLNLYGNISVDAALKKWSGGAYGAEAAGLPANTLLTSLNDSQKQQLALAIAKREDVQNYNALTSGATNNATSSQAAQYYAAYKGNPTAFDALSTDLKTAINSWAVANGQPPIGSQAGPSNYQQQQTAVALQAINDLKNKVSGLTTGVGGSLLSNIPGTAAADFEAKLDTLKSTIAFGALTAMREASKTGGALGQISDAEERLLSSSLGALSTRQSPSQFKQSLNDIEASINRWWTATGGTPTSVDLSQYNFTLQ